MKAKTLITIGAMMLAIIVIGCSNQSAIGPDNATDLRLSGDNGSGARFDNGNEGTTEIARIAPNPGMIFGEYYSDRWGCQSLEVSKDQYVELTFDAGVPSDIVSGTLVQVFGSPNIQPAGRCGLNESFQVTRLIVLTSDRSDGNESNPDGN